MSTTCQSYYTLKSPGDNIDKTHELYTLYMKRNLSFNERKSEKINSFFNIKCV